MKREKNFLDFILEAQKSKALTQGFLKADSAEKLMEFFGTKGFEGITFEDCRKLGTARANLPAILIKGMY